VLVRSAAPAQPIPSAAGLLPPAACRWRPRIIRDGSGFVPLSSFASLLAGTATQGTDYTGVGGATGAITFAAGSATAAVTVDPTADTSVESDETVALTLAAGTGYTIGTSAAVVGTITNDDVPLPAITLAVSPASVAEDGTANLIYTFSRTGSTASSLTVNYNVAGTATQGTDYTGVGGATGAITFAAGAATAAVTVDPTADTSVESDETVALTLAAGTGYTIGTSTAVVGTITNDDVPLPAITLAVSPASVAEDGTANLIYTFSRTGSTASSLTVNYNVAGTATQGTDYTGVGGATKAITFAAGAATAAVTVDPTADTSVESDETVALTLAAGTGYTIGTTVAAVGTITNDDAPTTPAPTNPAPLPGATTVWVFDFNADGSAPVDVTALPGYGVATSALFNFGGGGWAGWSVPAGKIVLGAKIISSGDTVADFSVFKAAGPNEVYPHWTYGPAEYGWVLQAKQINHGVQIEVYYANGVDLDVDSNNDGPIDTDNGPAGSDDPIEADTKLPGVIVPVGGDRAKMVVDVPKGITATLAFDATAAAKVKVFAASGAVVLEQGRLSTAVGGGAAQTFWIEAFAPSASMADIAFTLTPTGGSPASPDTIRATAVAANLVAHRTGGRLGDVIPENIESAGDPNTYMILTNRDFEQGLPLAGRDFDDGVALLPPFIGPEGRADDDLAKITLKRLPSGLNAGSVRLSVSHPDAVRLFKPVAGTIYGTVLAPGEWTAALASDEYLADLKSRDVDIWLEGLSMVKDFVFTVEYVAPSGSVLASDDVHMLIADWTFRGSDGYEVPFVSPVWLDALLAATDSPKKPLADPTGAFYKIHIDGLAPQLVTQLLVASDSTADFYTESYVGGDFDTAYSTATVSRRFGVLHSAAHVLYAPEDPVVTPAQRQLIRETLDLNVVYNDGLRATVQTPWDVQSDQLKKHGRFDWSLTEKPEGIYKGGDTIRGTVAWPEKMFPVIYEPFFMVPMSQLLLVQTDEDAGQSSRAIVAYQNTTVDFEFKARKEGYLRLTFSAADPNGIGFPPKVLSSILVRITADGTLPKWEAKAWDALKGDGFVPGDPINRNRQITTKYAEMFNTDKKPNELNPFEWFGMAAFASRLAGEGMHTAMRDGWAPLPDKPLFDVVPPSPQKVFAGLAEGNLEIFIDMYKAGLAYSENKFATINNSAEFSKEQKDAWQIIERGQTAGKIEVIWEGVDGLVDVEQRVALQRVLDKDPDLWRSATNNFVSASLKYRIYMIASPFPGDNSTFQDYRVNPDGNNPRIPADATFDQVEHRLTWIRSRIPKWRGGWRATYDYIEIPKLLNGDYNK
jgi:hypothetical protein